MVRRFIIHFAEGAFGSRHLNLLNIHLGIINFSQALRLTFGGSWLLHLGLSPAAVCFVMGCAIGLRFLARTPLLHIISRYGSKAALVAGQALLLATFALLANIDTPGPLLWLAVALAAAGEAVYWHATHTIFATLSEHGKYGRQVGARSLFLAFGALLTPVITGLTEPWGGWALVYAISAASVLLSLVPLCFIPEPCPPQKLDWREGLHTDKTGMQLYLGWGMGSALMMVLWPIILFLQLGSISKLASIMTLTTLTGLFLMLFVARRVDMGKGQRAARLGAIAYAVALLTLAAFGHDALSITLISAAMTLANYTFMPPYHALAYGKAKQTGSPLWFHYWSEFGWDIGNLITLWSAAAILWLSPALNLRWLMLGIIPAVAWCYMVYERSRSKAA